MNGLGAAYSVMSDVELHVHENDADAAREILARPMDDLEPVEDDAPDAAPVLGDQGGVIHLVAVGAFATLRDFRDATAVLASARHFRFYPPMLRPPQSGHSPPGEGKRFVLKVGQADRDHAEALLREAHAEAEATDEPRCPKCNSWRVEPVSQIWAGIKSFWGIGPRLEKRMECLACRHQASPGEFGAGE